MGKLIDDTLKNKEGKYSKKSVTWLVSFVMLIMYSAVVPMIHEIITGKTLFVSEPITLGLLGFIAGVIGIAETSKKFTNNAFQTKKVEKKAAESDDEEEVSEEDIF